MDNVLYCTRCGEQIAELWDTKWQRYIRLKYCPACRAAAKRQQTNESRRRTRKQKRAAKREARELLIKAKAENAQLRRLLAENEQLRRMAGRGTAEIPRAKPL